MLPIRFGVCCQPQGEAAFPSEEKIITRQRLGAEKRLRRGKSMHPQTMIEEFSLALLPPCCPDCLEVMQVRSTEPWTLLRAHQLVKYTFECNICGYSTASIRQEDR